MLFTMRTFLAIPLPAECLSMLDQMQKKLRGFGAEVGWAAMSSIHLTLRFLGDVAPESIPGLAASLKAATKPESSFELRLRGLGCFPNPRDPRVIWCGIEGDTAALLRLQQSVEAVCRKFGSPPEDRPFKPHLTLGRVKGKRNLQPLMDCIKIGSDLERSFSADCFNLYQSTLRPQGALYTVLETIALRGA
jgi:RNA 2',3'-cyclic 3'-phosphodiesterase